jgi:hypothetical protein
MIKIHFISYGSASVVVDFSNNTQLFLDIGKIKNRFFYGVSSSFRL